jgi:sphingomyelin phosphodiesterase 2
MDAWDAIHPPIEREPQFLSEEAQIDVLGVTCDSKLNTFTPTNLDTTTDDPNAKRIDYIFTSETVIEEAKVAFTERIPIHDINYSDHFGVSVTLQLPDFQNRKPTGLLPPEIFSSIREITASYVIRERKYSLLRICHFFLSLVICISMLTGVWFVEQKGYIFIMMFISTMCSWCGVLDGTIGFIWGRWELRSLREFAGEMDLARKVYGQEAVVLGQMSSD